MASMHEEFDEMESNSSSEDSDEEVFSALKFVIYIFFLKIYIF